MTYLSDRDQHLNRIGYATATAREAFRFCPDLEAEQKVVNAMITEIGKQIAGLVNVCTADFSGARDIDYLDGIEEVIKDDVDNAFKQAIDNRGAALDARRDPTERQYSESDYRREAAE